MSAILTAVDYSLLFKILTINRGATGAARVPKPGKTPVMAACRRHCYLFFKIVH